MGWGKALVASDSPRVCFLLKFLLSFCFAGSSWAHFVCVPFQNLIGHYIAYSHIARERQKERVSEWERFLCAGQAKSMLNHISNCAKAKGEWRMRKGEWESLVVVATTNGNGHAPLSGPSCWTVAPSGPLFMVAPPTFALLLLPTPPLIQPQPQCRH